MIPDIAAVAALLAAWPQVSRLLVGYSGGVDSHVLLHILATHREALGGRRLAAVHVNHGLAPQAVAWEGHCAAVCRDLGVVLEVVRVDARPRPGESPEAAARRARYDALAGLLRADTALLTAQHLDDQAETLLLQLLRGAGPRGLAAMPAAAPLGEGRLLRPFLEIRRDAIVDYARRHGLTWVEDASNADTRLDRNYLRHQVMPVLRRRWPAAAQTLGRSARLCADAAGLLDDLADADLERAAGGRPDRLQLEALPVSDPPRLRNALRRWFIHLDLPPPAAVHLRHVLADVIAAPRDRQGRVGWPGAEVRRHGGFLYAMAPLPDWTPQSVPLSPDADGRYRAVIAGVGRITLEPVAGQGLRGGALAGRRLSIGFRQGGERFRPAGRRHSQALKKLLQEAAVPPWERERLPLLYADETLAAVADLWVAADLAAAADEAGWVLQWQKAWQSATLSSRPRHPL